MFINMKKPYKKAVTFSYDDGVVFDEKLIDIFNKYGIKATFNITDINKNEDIPTWTTEKGLPIRGFNFMNEKNVRIYDGHEIAGHTRHHYWLNKIDDKTLEEEILGNKEDLERVFGEKINGIAYPFNTYDDRAVNILRENGFLYAREGSETHSFDLQEDLLRFRPTEYDDLKIFYIWGHSYEFEDDNNWDRIEKLCRLIGGKDDILYGTNSQVFRLQKEWEKFNCGK